ncbi:hypothetical protein Tco_0407388 [Tanacetum coccineum]
MQSQPQQTNSIVLTQTEKGIRDIGEEPKKKKLTLQQIRALETKNDEDIARKVQAEWDAEEERKRLEALKKPKTISKEPYIIYCTRKEIKCRSFLKGSRIQEFAKTKVSTNEGIVWQSSRIHQRFIQGFYSNGLRKGKRRLLQEEMQRGLLRKRKAYNYRRNSYQKAFDTLWEILHILDRQDLHHLYLVVQDYYKHIPPTGLGLILLGDLTTIWETSTTRVHTLELEDGTMIHMLTERRYPLSRELMIRMLDHGMEVEDESDIAITLIHLFILWTTEDGDDS